jgi:hypothetical protein
MKLRRRGSRRNYGWADMFDSHRPTDKPTLHWDEKETTLILRLPNARDPTSFSNHHYELILGIDDVNVLLDFLRKDPLLKSGPAISEGLIASSHSLFHLLLSSLISDLEGLRHTVTTRSDEMSRTVQQVNVELSKLRAEVEQLSSDRDSARH